MNNLKTKIHYNELEEYGFGPNVMKKNKVCSNCGTVVSAELENCNICGTHLPEETLFIKYISLHKVCPVCNCVVKVNANYCPQCRTVFLKDKNVS